tara:strand:+ start:655 stop:1020 length:366 start_codon:yes stop_codon:yes gene_type:complete
MTATILNQQLSDASKEFASLSVDDFEGKVRNIKNRIFLMHKKLNENGKEHRGNPVKVVSTPNEEQNAKRAEMDDLRRKLTSKPSKGFPKETKSLPFDEKDMASKNADEELKRALNKAFESI